MSDMTAWAVVMLALSALLALVALLMLRPPGRERICVACGHERGWHQSYWPTKYRHLEGCQRGHCFCPAGRRSIR